MSRDYFENAHTLGNFVRKGSIKPPSPTAMALSMRTIGARATSLLVEVDGLISEVEDYVLAHSEHWTKGECGMAWSTNLERLREWRDYIQEIGADSLIWE